MEELFKNSDGIEASMQTTGSDLAMDVWNTFDNAELKYYCDDFSVVECLINNAWSMVIIKTAMIPNDPFFAEEVQELIPMYYEHLLNQYHNDLDDYDVYYMGIRLTQTRVPENEQSIYKIGGKYSGQSSPILLLKKANKSNYGYTTENPINLSDVSDEYYFMKNIKSDFGEIINVNRDGSCFGMNDNIIDEWSIMVQNNNNRYLYKIYMDPYALKAYENPFENGININGFELKTQNNK